MGGHRVVRHGEPPGDLAGGQPLGLVRDKQLERIEPGRLRESRQAEDHLFPVHLSIIYDGWMLDKRI